MRSKLGAATFCKTDDSLYDSAILYPPSPAVKNHSSNKKQFLLSIPSSPTFSNLSLPASSHSKKQSLLSALSFPTFFIPTPFHSYYHNYIIDGICLPSHKYFYTPSSQEYAIIRKSMQSYAILYKNV